MTIIRLSQVIKRPEEDVVDAGNFSSWNPTIKSSRQISPGEIGEGSRFEWKLRGFGRVHQELEEFDRDRRVRIVPDSRFLTSGHRFTFTDLGEETRIDHELEMSPKGVFKVMGPILAMTGRSNLRATTDALQRHMEHQ